MRNQLTILLVFTLTFQIAFGQNKDQDLKRFSADTISGIYIPIDLDDCFKQIDGFWSDSTKIKVKLQGEDYFIVNTHHGFGLWIRNNWQLWSGSRLSKYFQNMGVDHPDDMSGIILTSYHRYLAGEEINLKQQIESSKTWWKEISKPSSDIYPNGEKDLEFTTIFYKLKDGKNEILHIQSNSKTDKIWIYGYHLGWKQLSRDEVIQISSTPREKRDETIRLLLGQQK
jgi:hypothetical protein